MAVPTAPLWALVGAVILFFLAIGAALVMAMVGFAIAIARGDIDPATLSDPEAAQRALMTNLPIVGLSLLGQSLVMLIGPFVIARLNRADIKEGLGFRSAHPATFVAGSLGVLALGPTSDALVRWLQEVAPDWSIGSLEGLDALAKADVPLALLLFMMAVTPGFTEEILFRGLIQRSLRRRALALHVSAITFALIHADPHHVIGVVPVGYFLAWVALRADSTWPTIVAHIANNAVAVLAVRALETDLGEPPPLWALPVGWAVCALCVLVIRRTTPTANTEPPAPVSDSDSVPGSAFDAVPGSTFDAIPGSVPVPGSDPGSDPDTAEPRS